MNSNRILIYDVQLVFVFGLLRKHKLTVSNVVLKRGGETELTVEGEGDRLEKFHRQMSRNTHIPVDKSKDGNRV